MYFKKIIAVGLIAYVLSLAIGAFLDMRYKKRWSTLFFDKTEMLINDSTYYDAIYFGNSRIQFGINPFYIDSLARINSYNFGYGGSDAEEIMLMGNLFLQNHRPPKAVVLSIDLGAFLRPNALKSRFHYLFYLKNDSIYKHMKQVYPAAWAIKIFPFTKYSFFDEYNRTSLFVKNKPYPVFDHNIYRGFLNVQQQINKPGENGFNTTKDESTIIDNDSKSYLKHIISSFANAGTKVIVISPPEKSTALRNQPRLHKLRDSLVQDISYGKTIYQFKFTKTIGDKYFTDDVHLNEPGTKVFSLQLADSIKSVL